MLLCDVWGVVHNGSSAFPRACDALMRARARGAPVVLITNAPRPSAVVARQLEKLHVPRETYDAIVSSGDVTRAVIEERRGQSLYHLGPERDRSMFDGFEYACAARARRLRGLLGTGGRRDRDAGGLPRAAGGDA